MNEPIKKQPVDELFARKLANLSLPPDRQGFARLQARMRQEKQPEKNVFWRTPTFQRSVAAAACVVLLVTLGWHRQSANSTEATVDTQKTIARNKQPLRPVEQPKLDVSEAVADLTIQGELADNANRDENKGVGKVADDEKRAVELAIAPKSRISKPKAGASMTKAVPVNELIEQKSNDEQVASTTSTPVKENVMNTPSAASPRTLVVTIAEPDVLVAARQTAQEADQKLVVVNRNTNETGAGKLWRKIQQIRSGETAIANAPADEDEKGLLDRAYSEIKQSFQKNKPVRQ